MKQTLAKKFNKQVRCVFNTFKVGQCFTLKSKTPKHLESNVIYKFTCRHDADISYVGKTKRQLSTRVAEHTSSGLKDEGDSAVKKHIAECQYCPETNLESFEIIKKTHSSFDVLIYEVLFIKKYKPSLNRQLFKSGSFYTCKVF